MIEKPKNKYISSFFFFSMKENRERWKKMKILSLSHSLKNSHFLLL